VTALWHLTRPFALALVGPSILLALTVFRPGHHAVHHPPATRPMFLSLMVQGLWYGSIAPCPGVSLLDALIYFGAGYHGFQRTRLVRVGMLTAAVTGFVGFAVLFATAAIITPGLVLATFANPLLFLILSVYLVIPLGYSAVLGTLASVVGKWVAPTALS
jgi:hypothetical protein